MLNKALICIVMLAVIFGCANQRKDDTEKPTEQTEATDQAEQAEVADEFEEISITVTGMT